MASVDSGCHTFVMESNGTVKARSNSGTAIRRSSARGPRSGVMIAAAALLVVGCAVPAGRPTMPYTPMEQLMISEAIARGMAEFSLDLRSSGSSLHLEMTGLTADHLFLADVLEGWLGRLGFRIESNPQDSDYTIRVIVQSIGTSRDIKLLGMPASSSTLLPISLPELAIYKRDRREGYTRFYFDIFDAKSGEYVQTSRDFEGSVEQTKFTFLFVFGFTRSELPRPSLHGGMKPWGSHTTSQP